MSAKKAPLSQPGTVSLMKIKTKAPLSKGITDSSSPRFALSKSHLSKSQRRRLAKANKKYLRDQDTYLSAAANVRVPEEDKTKPVHGVRNKASFQNKKTKQSLRSRSRSASPASSTQRSKSRSRSPERTHRAGFEPDPKVDKTNEDPHATVARNHIAVDAAAAPTQPKAKSIQLATPPTKCHKKMLNDLANGVYEPLSEFDRSPDFDSSDSKVKELLSRPVLLNEEDLKSFHDIVQDMQQSEAIMRIQHIRSTTKKPILPISTLEFGIRACRVGLYDSQNIMPPVPQGTLDRLKTAKQALKQIYRDAKKATADASAAAANTATAPRSCFV